MTLLNGILAFGAAAFVVPVIIHLLNRSRFRTIPWGAMHLLESVIRVNNRRIRMEQILLLLVRCTIPVLLALCLARPVLTGWRALPGDAPASTVVLLDNSYSMDAASGDRPHFAEAIDQACAILDDQSRGSEVSVLTMGGGPCPVLDCPIFDARTMIQHLRRLPGGYGACQVIDSLESAMAVVAGMANARRNLILISDFQSADWERLSSATRSRIRGQLDAMPIRPTLTLLHVGGEVVDNVSIDSLTFSRQALGTGQDLQIRAHLRNRGRTAYPHARVVFRVDGAQRDVSRVAIGAQTAAQALFTHQFDKPGSHVLDLEMTVDDRLKTDNRYAAAVPVLKQMDVLLVDGAPSSEPLGGETDFLAVALTPFTYGRVRLSDLIETRTIPLGEFKKETVAAARVVVLANVAQLSDDQVGLLRDYVSGGGSLLVFFGNKTNVDWYNRTLCLGTAGLLPMQIGALAGSPDQPDRATRIVAQHFEHPALQVFNDRANGNLADAEIRSWYRLGRSEAAEDRPTAEPPLAGEPETLVLARLETGDPLIVESRFGDGLVVQVATACDADWSNLPMRPVYLPLMQQLVTTMATEVTPARNIRTGEPAVALLPAGSRDLPLALSTPDGTRHTVRPAARGTQAIVDFRETRQPGVYTLTGPDARPLHFVADTSREESDLRVLDDAQLETLAADLGGDLVRSSAEYLDLDRTRRHGRELWRFLFFGVVGLVLLELFLQQRFAQVKG